MAGVFEELRFALRYLSERPGTSALSVVALALGIGLTTTTFSIVYGMVLRGLPLEDAGRILYVGAVDRTRPGPPRGFIIHDYLDVREAQRSFELAAYAETDVALEAGDGVPLRYETARLTPNAFQVLRTGPILGRGFTDADAVPGSAASRWRASASPPSRAASTIPASRSGSCFRSIARPCCSPAHS